MEHICTMELKIQVHHSPPLRVLRVPVFSYLVGITDVSHQGIALINNEALVNDGWDLAKRVDFKIFRALLLLLAEVDVSL